MGMLTYEEMEQLNRAELWARMAYNVTAGPGVLVDADVGIGIRIGLQTRAVQRKYVTVLSGTGPYSYNTLEANANTNGAYRTENSLIGEEPGNTTFRPLFDRNGRVDLPPGLKVVAEYHCSPSNTQREQWITDYHMLTLSNTAAGGGSVNVAYLGVANTQLNKQNFALTNTGAGFPHSVFVDLNTDISITNSVNTKYVTIQNTNTFVSAPLNTTVIQMAFGHLKVSTNHNTTITNCCIPCKPSTDIIGTSTGGYWRFEEVSSPFLDSSGNSRNLESSGTTSVTATGKVGAGRYWDTSETSSITSAAFTVTANVTIDVTFWWKRSGSTDTSLTEIVKVALAPVTFQVCTTSGDSTSISLQVTDGTTDAVATTTWPTDNDWHFVHAKWVPGTVTASISIDDGTDVTDTAGGIASQGTSMVVSTRGGRQAVTGQLTWLDEVLLQLAALTTAQVTSLYNSRRGTAGDCKPIQPSSGGTGAPLDSTGSPGQYLNQAGTGAVIFPTEPAYDAYVLDAMDSISGN